MNVLGMTIFTRDREGVACTRSLCPRHAEEVRARYRAIIGGANLCMSAVMAPDVCMDSEYDTEETCGKCWHERALAAGKIEWDGWGWSIKK